MKWRKVNRATTPGVTLNDIPEYKVWQAIKNRCLNESSKVYPSYGGRGITLYAPWRTDFMAFMDHMGPRPLKHTVERLDNNLGYEPGNVTWATRSAQQKNRRNNVWLEFQGKRQVLADWVREADIPFRTLTYRLRKGWSTEAALTTKPARVGRGVHRAVFREKNGEWTKTPIGEKA